MNIIKYTLFRKGDKYMQIYSGSDCIPFITPVDVSGDKFTFNKYVDYGVHGPYTPIPTALITQIMSNIHIPLDWLTIPLFALPFSLMIYQSGYGWSGTCYNGKQYDNSHIIYTAMDAIPSLENASSLITHEIGHAFCAKFVDGNYDDKVFTAKFMEYWKLRGIPSSWTDNGPWENSPSELFAEDFRYLFEPFDIISDPYPHYQYIAPPGEDIRSWMMALLPVDDVKIELVIGDTDCYVDGRKTILDTAPLIINSRTLIPIRFISETLGFTVGWTSNDKPISISNGKTNIALTIGSSIVVVNGVASTLDVYAQIINNRTYVPLRFISEAFGKTVTWLAASSGIVIV